jgi:rhodanese-related sulfurtransferase
VGQSRRVIFYGCGTVADYLIGSLYRKPGKYRVVSGLNEELGMQFRGVDIEAVTNIDYVDSDIVLITALGYESFIFDNYFKNKGLENVYCIVKELKSEDIIYGYSKCIS